MAGRVEDLGRCDGKGGEQMVGSPTRRQETLLVVDAEELAGANLSGVNVNGADLFDVDLTGACLEERTWKVLTNSATLVGADLGSALLRGASLDDISGIALLDEAMISIQVAVVHDATIMAVADDPARLEQDRLNDVDLGGADLSRAYLGSSFLISVNLEEANLE